MFHSFWSPKSPLLSRNPSRKNNFQPPTITKKKTHTRFEALYIPPVRSFLMGSFVKPLGVSCLLDFDDTLLDHLHAVSWSQRPWSNHHPNPPPGLGCWVSLPPIPPQKWMFRLLIGEDDLLFFCWIYNYLIIVCFLVCVCVSFGWFLLDVEDVIYALRIRCLFECAL